MIYKDIIAVFNHLRSQGWRIGDHTFPQFEAMEFPNNRLIASPMPMSPLYRGESDNFPKSNPTIYRREWSLIEKIEQKLQMHDFQHILNDHPEIKALKEANVGVNYIGLAQHYGLKTNLMDLTNSPLVASFFATTTYDSKSDTYTPIVDNTKVGVLYFNKLGVMGTDFHPRTPILPIGLEALRRPGEQRGFSIEMGENDDLNNISGFIKFVFQHSAEVSKRIFKATNSGQMFFPYDPMCDKIRDMIKNKQYSLDALDSVFQFGGFGLSYNSLKSLMEDYGCSFYDESLYLYTDKELAFIEKDMEQIANNNMVTTRLCFIPKNG